VFAKLADTLALEEESRTAIFEISAAETENIMTAGRLLPAIYCDSRPVPIKKMAGDFFLAPCSATAFFMHEGLDLSTAQWRNNGL
jgi:hypothetical protein